MSAGVRRALAWAVGVICLVVIVGLVIAAGLDLRVADGTASVVSAVVAVIGLALSVITLLVTPANAGPAATTVAVRARGRRSLSVAGDVQGSAIGDRSKVIGPSTPSSPPAQSPGAPVRHDVSASGGATAVGGNMVDSALGEDSERRTGEDNER
ncbi:hypothetical protein ABZ471_20910 [Streptomyces sp. NPDC005728]|uniref:hypothetical protein n=1 Tax=Streptomyces sp. NPDC005728 TaxID=3157054 RepID=UPI0034074E9D